VEGIGRSFGQWSSVLTLLTQAHFSVASLMGLLEARCKKAVQGPAVDRFGLFLHASAERERLSLLSDMLFHSMPIQWVLTFSFRVKAVVFPRAIHLLLLLILTVGVPHVVL
jgi:hypothetical protein